MKTVLHISITFALFATLALTNAANANGSQKESPASPTVVEGLVRDISCAVQNKNATATTFNMPCALACARQGSPLIILTKDGTMYVPISDSMPDKDQRGRLMPFVGKYVKATGIVYERTGTHAIALKEIIEMKEVHLVTDAQ